MIWETLLTSEVVSGVGAVVGEYLFGKVGDSLIDHAVMNRKIKQILKKDKKHIREVFANSTYSTLKVEDIEKFLINNIFQDIHFLYPVSFIPEKAEIMLWEKYCEVNTFKEWNPLKEDESRNIRNNLVDCVNYHNELIRQYQLDGNTEIILRKLENNHSDLLGYIGQTMNSNSEFQYERSKLDYMHKQLEGILHAARMDLRHYKLLLFITVIGVILFSFLTILIAPIFAQYYSGEGVDRLYIILGTIIIFIFFVLVFLFLNTLKNVFNRERKIDAYTDALWELHFDYYSFQLQDMSKVRANEEGHTES